MQNQNEEKKLSAAPNESKRLLSAKLWCNQQLATAEMMKSSPPLDDLARGLTVELWAKTLLEIGEERFYVALQKTLEASTFRPDIAEIRKFAGIPVIYPIEQEAKDELAKIIPLLRHHGRKLTNRGKPEKEPPGHLGEPTMGTIADMGFGDIRAGLEAVWAHPALDLVRPPAELDEMETFRAVAGEKIERRWVEYYTRRKAEGFKRLGSVS